MDSQLPKTYDPQAVEKKWYDFWEENGFFAQVVDPEQKPFSIVMPPPNVTGVLHLGHAMDNAMQDVLTRFKRMQGCNTLWLPGTDHAGIATEAKVAEQLAKEGTSREAVGREGFVERAWDWKREYGGNITQQLRRLGASCDWSRERFTMDEGCSLAVRRVFAALYERGLIYRGNYIINWCSKCLTTISDIEVEHAEQAGHLWFIRYPAEDGSLTGGTSTDSAASDGAASDGAPDGVSGGASGRSSGGASGGAPGRASGGASGRALGRSSGGAAGRASGRVSGGALAEGPSAGDSASGSVADGIVVATTRPETMLGDVAVAVHPDDERYQHLIGKNVILPLMNKPIPVIADTYVDSSFGTGAVKITPAHDPNDFDMGLRHNLEQISILDDNGCINENGGPYQGLPGAEARRRVVEDLETLGLLVGIEEHNHAVGHCYRCDTVVEPRVSRQWFVRMAPLAAPAMEAVRQGRIEFVPERFTRVYLGWMENIRDWCISRQLWWGHRIPVWYCEACGAEICSVEDPVACPQCQSTWIEQETDVLDTWFSSALWPFSTMGWPRETEELKHFYPTSVLVTGRDIIFFWVARMILMGLEFMGDVPFHKVMIHGLILDREGQKMSKTRGNGIDPLEIIENYGADTLRFMLLTGNTPGNDLRFYAEKLDATRNFLNKIWNASRFGLMHLADVEPGTCCDRDMGSLTVADRWILSRYEGVAEEVSRRLEDYDLGEAGRLLYEFVWNELCDWYIEMAKPRLYGRGDGSGPAESGSAESISAESRSAGSTERADLGPAESAVLAMQTARKVLYTVLEGSMRLLHPFLPFLTEEIWQHLPHEGETVMLCSWPQPSGYRDENLERDMEALIEVIRAVRNIRSEYGVAPSRKIKAVLFCADTDIRDRIVGALADIKLMAGCDSVEVLTDPESKPSQAAVAALDGIQVFVPLKGMLDLDKERLRIDKEIANAVEEEKRLGGKLNNPGFVNKAPADVVAGEREKLAAAQRRLESLRQRQLEMG
ncbi:MAG: valine--tRNA ligase [Peptococcaceae bacterium]|nr:valine--tRNA ligase [Peptococcaceae bacterium]